MTPWNANHVYLLLREVTFLPEGSKVSVTEDPLGVVHVSIRMPHRERPVEESVVVYAHDDDIRGFLDRIRDDIWSSEETEER